MTKTPFAIWNYRIVKRTGRRNGENVTLYGLHEVYYDDLGNPTRCTVKPQAGPAESVEELLEELRMMARDAYKTRKDILDYSQF